MVKLRASDIFKALRLFFLVALSGFVLAALWCETVGVPRVFVASVVRALERRGISCDIGQLKAGVFGGIRMEKVHVWDGEAVGETMFTAERLDLRLRKRQLFRGRLAPGKLTVEGGRLFFPTPPGEDGRKRQPFVIEELNGGVDFRAQDVANPSFSGRLQGLPLRIAGSVTGFQDMPPPDAEEDRPLSWRRVNQRIPAAVSEALPKLGDFLARQQFIADDSLLDADIHLDVRDFAACTADVRFQLAGVSLRNASLSKVRGNLMLEKGRLTLPRLTVDMGLNAYATASGEYDIAERRIAGRLAGVIDPPLFFRLFDRPMPRLLAEMSFPTPPSVSLILAPSPALAPRDWRVTGTVAVKNVVWEGTYLRSVECEFSRADHRLTLHRLVVEADGRGHESVSLHGEFDERELTLTGEAVARIAPERLMRLIPPDAIATRRLLRSVQFLGDVPTVTVNLDKARWRPFDVRGGATLVAEAIVFRGLELKKIVLPLVFDGETLQTAAAGGELTICDRQSVVFHGRLDTARKTLSLAGDASLFPLAIYRGLALPPWYVLDDLRPGAAPVALSFAFDDIAWDFSDWRATGSVEARNVGHGEMDFASLVVDFEVTPEKVAMTNLQGESPDGRTLLVPHASWNWRTSTLRLELAGQLDPLSLAYFINPASRSTFESVWRHFSWEGTDPDLAIDTFELRFFGSRRWHLKLNGRLAGESFVFKGIPVDKGAADFVLDLPRRIDVSAIRAERGDAWLEGAVAFELGAEPIMTLDCEGVFDPVESLGVVSPAWRETLADVTSSGDTRLTIDGQFYLKGKLRPQIDCRMEGSRLAARGLVVHDYTADWQLQNHELKWRFSRADLFGGALVANGYSNVFTHAGKIDAQFKNVDLSELLTNYRGRPANENLGALSGHLALVSARSTDREQTTLVGDGKVRIRDGELYRTPIVESLVSLIGLSRVGQITACDAELEFRGDHLVVPRFATNGTILALRGDGAYHWAGEKQGVDFTVRGEVLRATSLIPLLTRPLSWFFEAQLTGPPDNLKWGMRSPLRALMPGGSDNEPKEPGDFDLLPPKD